MAQTTEHNHHQDRLLGHNSRILRDGLENQPPKEPPTSTRAPRVPKGKPKIVLETNLTASFLHLTWVVHLLAVGATAAVVQLSFRGVWWADDEHWESKWYLLDLDQQETMNALQFLAKVHELLIVSSVSAKVLHFARWRLLGRGLPLGLLSGTYQVGSVEWLFSSSFLAPLCSSTWFFALVMGALVVYLNMVGPSSAIAVIPNLQWWPMPDPFDDASVAAFITAGYRRVYPQILGAEQMTCGLGQESLNGPHAFCPAGGYDDIRLWTSSESIGDVDSKLTMFQPALTYRRELQSTLAMSNYGTLAVATTLHANVVSALGGFWNYIDKFSLGPVVNASRPQFLADDNPNLYAPVVQVQCGSSLLGVKRGSCRQQTVCDGQAAGLSHN